MVKRHQVGAATPKLSSMPQGGASLRRHSAVHKGIPLLVAPAAWPCNLTSTRALHQSHTHTLPLLRLLLHSRAPACGQPQPPPSSLAAHPTTRLHLPLHRAEEHLPNTLRQVLIYDALGFPRPTFGHVSLILAPDKSKLSKRWGCWLLRGGLLGRAAHPLLPSTAGGRLHLGERALQPSMLRLLAPTPNASKETPANRFSPILLPRVMCSSHFVPEPQCPARGWKLATLAINPHLRSTCPTACAHTHTHTHTHTQAWRHICGRVCNRGLPAGRHDQLPVHAGVERWH